MTDTTVGIKVVADTSDVTVELGKIDRAAVKTAGELEKVGKGNGFKRTGEDAAAGASKMEAAQRNMIGSIQRTTAAMEAGGKTTAKYYELLAQQRGVDTGALAPYLAQLRAVEAAQAKSNAALGGATPALDKMGLSAKQTAAALRGVPAQFTDIFTSLQGGQAPLTVFLQQGGQLKDMFGGAGNAARAMGGYIVGLINPFTVAAAAAVGLVVAYNQGANEAQAYTRSLVMTGNAAGTTADQLGDMARNISDTVGTQGAAAEALAAMAGTGRVAAANLEYFSEVAIKAQRTLGIGAADMAKDFELLGKAPLKGSEQLTEKYRYLTAAVYEQIKAAEEQGRVEEAASIAQNAYAVAMDDRTAKVKASLGTLETAWANIGAGAKKAWDLMLNVGREDTLTEKLTRVQAQIEKARKPFDPAVGGNAEARAQLQANLQLEASLQRQIKGEAEKAAAQAAALKRQEAMQAWSKEGDKYLSKEVALQREITKARTEGAAAGKSQAEIEQRIADIRKARTQTGGKGADDALRKESALMAELAGLTSSFAADWNVLSAAYAKGKINLEQLTEAQAQLLAKQPAMRAGAEAEAKAQKEAAAAAEQAIKVRMEFAAKSGSMVEAANKEAAANEHSAATFGMTAAAIAELEIARLEDQLTQLRGIEMADDEVAALERVIEAKKRSAAAMQSLETKTASKQATDEIAADYKRMAESIENSLTDALMRGFESGKSFGRNLMDTLKNMFKTLILQPTIKGILAPVSGAMASAFGPSTAQAATGSAGSSAGSAIGSVAGGLFGAGGLAGSVAAGAGWLTGATTLTGSLTAAGSLAATGTLGGIASSIGMVAGALGPIALALGAAVMIWKKLDTSGTYHTGGAASANASGTSVIRSESLGFAQTRTNSEAEQAAAALASSVVGILDSTATAFGKTAGYTAATAFADDTSKDGAWGALMIQKMGQTVLDWNSGRSAGSWAPKEFADGEAGRTQYLAELAKSVRMALDDIGLPSWAQTMLDGLGEGASIEQMGQVVDNINATQKALKAMGDNLVGFASMSDAAVSALMKASGGIAALSNGAAAYYENFYNDGEKSAVVVKQIAAALGSVGLALPKTRDEFRGLVEAQQRLGEAGAPALAALLGVAGAFAQITPAAGDAVSSLSDARNALSEAYQRESDAIRATTDRMASFITSLRTLRSNALLGGLSPLTPQQKYAEAREQYEKVLAGVRNGDEGAQGRYQEAYTAFLTASQMVNSSGAAYQRDFAYAQAQTADVISLTESQVDIGKASLAALQAQVSGLIDINKSVLTVAEAIRNLSAAMGSSGPGAVSSGQTNAIESLYQSLLGRKADAAGLEFWKAQLDKGVSISDIATAITQSAEFTGSSAAAQTFAPVNYSAMGTANMAPLATEIKNLRTSNEALLSEVKSLRTDAQEQTSALIDAAASAEQSSTSKVVDATLKAGRLYSQVKNGRVPIE